MSEMAHDTHAAQTEHGHDHDEGHAHASPGFYWMIGGILGVLTGLEVAAFYVKPPFEVEILLILSAIKFVLVVGFFMHLKFDSRVFTGVFVAGLALAILMVSGMFALYHLLPPNPAPPMIG